MKQRHIWLACVLLALGTGGTAAGEEFRPLPAMQQAAPRPDDSEAARAAAIARLRAAPPREVCRDEASASQVYGTSCASREFPAPPLLQAPKFQWQVNPGWWAVWSPFLIDGKVLTGSCNNDDNKGLSALDMRNGKTLWRIGDICDEGNRAGSMGRARFYELNPQTVLFELNRDDGKPNDFYVVDARAGKIVRTLKPLKRGPLLSAEGVFSVITHSTKESMTYLTGLNEDLSKILWRHESFRFRCDPLDRHCLPVFSTGAAHDGMLYFTATAVDQPEPPTRQLHAFDLHSGRLLWRHTDQPRYDRWQQAGHRSEDGPPLVADGKVIVKWGTYLDQDRGLPGQALRALDARTGAVVWTSAPVPQWSGDRLGIYLGNRIAAGDMLIAEVQDDGGKELFGYRLADGQLMWRRPVDRNDTLTASSGGVFYLAESEREGKEESVLLRGLDARTGTLLWSTRLPGHNLPFTGEWAIEEPPSILLQGPSWRIGRDGAIYGITLKGAYKLR